MTTTDGKACGQPIGDCLAAVLNDLEHRYRTSGTRPLSDHTGWAPAGLGLLAARNGIAHDGPVAYYYLAGTTVDATYQLISQWAGVSVERLSSATLIENDWPKLSYAIDTLRDTHLVVDGTHATAVEAFACAGRNSPAARVVVVDGGDASY